MYGLFSGLDSGTDTWLALGGPLLPPLWLLPPAVVVCGLAGLRIALAGPDIPPVLGASGLDDGAEALGPEWAPLAFGPWLSAMALMAVIDAPPERGGKAVFGRDPRGKAPPSSPPPRGNSEARNLCDGRTPAGGALLPGGGRRRPVGAMPDAQGDTFQLEDETHTLGNALRLLLNGNPDVEFAGYSVPHPADNVVHVRVQTKGQVKAKDALKDAATTLADMCDVLDEAFDKACEKAGVPDPKTGYVAMEE